MATSPAVLLAMANIASQEKRIHRTERERLENRRYTSSLRTAQRRLRAAADANDAAAADDAYKLLCSRIDRAVRSGALHRNAGSRKKARATKLRASL